MSIYLINLLYWFIPALIMLSVKPEASEWLRIGRLFAVFTLCYGTIAFDTYMQFAHEWEGINTYRTAHPECNVNSCENAPNATINGAQLSFAFVMGWIPAIILVGVWEACWRLIYRVELSKLNIPLQYSNIILIASLLVGVVSLYIFGFNGWAKWVMHPL